MKNDFFWFYVYPNVHVKISINGSLLLYNTSNGCYLISRDSVFNKYIMEVYEPKSLGIIKLDKTSIKSCKKSIVEKAKKKMLINYISVLLLPTKPINFLPILNLQKDFDFSISYNDSMGDDIISYLSCLNIFLLSDGRDCSGNYINEQLLYPIGGVYSGFQLGYKSIIKILDESIYSIMRDVNFLGGSLKLYNDWGKLVIELKRYTKYKFHVWVTESDLCDIDCFFDSLFCYDVIFVPYASKCIENIMINLLDLSYREVDLTLHIYVRNEDEYERYSKMFNMYKLDIQPLYYRNLSFFKRNVFLRLKDITSNRVSMKSVFCNQKINSNCFGILNIYPDGSVKALSASSIIGNIYANSLKEIIYNELIINTAWRRIRNVGICAECCFKYICPPPSQYEKVIGRNNLCFIKSS